MTSLPFTPVYPDDLVHKGWTITRYGYEWHRLTDRWELSWPADKPYAMREKRERHTCPDWVWAAYCADQLIGDDFVKE